ncbi:MAG: FtsK/SpoIIIE domain-containing protein [Mediterraneibacter gnavus]
MHGANEIQYLTLGVGVSHHALIAGVAGSGKSSLLHTIILQALSLSMVQMN